MPTPFKEGGLVHLDLGKGSGGLVCRIAGFGPDDLVLLPVEQPDPETATRLAERPEAMLLVDSGAGVRALGAQVVEADDALVVRITDRFRLGQRRMFSRAHLVLPAVVRPDGAQDGWRTFTRDVSAGGCRLARQSTYVAAPEHELELKLPRENAVVRARAVVVRESATDLSVRFVSIEDGDRLLLAWAAIDWQRKRLGAPAP